MKLHFTFPKKLTKETKLYCLFDRLSGYIKYFITKISKDKQNIYEEFFSMKIGEVKEVIFDINNLKELNLGYLIYQGFELISSEHIEKSLKKIKIKRVSLNKKEDKTYSLLIKLPRTGKHGKRIYVYKLRTMYPYSEYLHLAIIKINGLRDDGTIRNDFRITKLGRFFRKYWIDELPMLLNFLKGDLKIIGVRPLSDAMLSQYPADFIPFRNQFKPGLIPPYYIDRPKSFEEIIESEKRYLELYEKAPIKTDLIYFCKFLDRVLLKGVRSK